MTRTSTSAVLYICAERSQGSPGLARERAEQEGRDFASTHDLHIVDEITDPYGDPTPQNRAGWVRVRELVERDEVDAVITRWPNSLSMDSELRYAEMEHLAEYGVQVRFSWAPLATMADSGASR
ncbi:hypothetical protein [Streptomyces sp. NBC_01187]|uniref:hypothetical protein n=1 Tax=Streptomyces sp. NBC_01187 TaxID=2903766 RepID=UPI003865B29B|nr:hypothetical protein OG220_17865 [Streptomyces sp. NBC_01187]